MQKNKGKNCFITIDFEDWFTIPYLKKYNFKTSDYFSFCNSPNWDPFFQELVAENIHPTFFVVATVIPSSMKVIKEASQLGFSFGCHSYDHDNLKNMTLAQFISSTTLAKKQIEDATGSKVLCYRAPFFSANKEKILCLSKMGFEFDSSYIHSTSNPYYEKNDFSDWAENADGFLVNPDSSLLEAEIPTTKIFGKNIPIGGGGFFRLYPFFLYKFLVKKYLRSHNSFVFFIHPYEIDYQAFPGTRVMSIKDRLRFDLGRKKAIKKFWRLIRFLKKEGLTFNNFNFYSKKELKSDF